MLIKFQNQLNQKFPFLKEKKLLLAISGGIDSMVLVHLLHELKYSFAVAHCNFQLRNIESNEDESFVISVCEKLKTPFFTVKFDTKKFAEDYKLSIQLAARKLRYDWFYELLEKENCDYILTAHHLDDSLETFLINFTRGTGLEGLTGIPVQNDKIIRPLLPFSRKEIEDFAHENKIKWREDSSNASDKYLRNKLRHDVIPTLKELQPNLISSFDKTIENLQQSQSLVEDASKLVYKIVVEEQDNLLKINLKELLKLPNYNAYLFQWLKDFGFTAWSDIADLVNAQSGKQVFCEEFILLKDRDYLILSPKNEIDLEEVFLVYKEENQVNIPLKFEFCNIDDTTISVSNSIFVDEDKIQFPLMLRKWREGDYFYPLGMKGKKKLSKYFKDEKLSLIDKSQVWLLCSNNQIIWVIGKRQDERFKVETNTNNIVQIRIK
ncbi:MAG: tRNA lysidine(34) synthetase TilS [Flavobacterium sp.]|uniref:tRNA lysidine(34) synthetase TilS n=1 Tax=Flavobacterium sp. TaxID=239 RepID=UPI0022CB4D55|nr:tRNA lysidine(34) synthetase TilS [Flavobacterium sp.]MCZ8196833.1 tRNA lysidine(34) synthetase TilS [Flavobacterium sp.]